MVTEKEMYEKTVGPWEREVFFKSFEKPAKREAMIKRFKNSAILQKLLMQFPEIKKIRVETGDTAYEIRRR